MRDLPKKSEGGWKQFLYQQNDPLTRSSVFRKVGIVLLLLAFLIPSGISANTMTVVNTSEQISFPTIKSTKALLEAMGRSPSDQHLTSLEGLDQSAGIACSLKKESGGTVQFISPQEEAEQIRAVQQYIKKNNLSWTAGKTSVSNLTPAAYDALRGLKHPVSVESYPVRAIEPTSSQTKTALPVSFDWRDNEGDWTTPIKNQANCGACWAFASTATFESFWERIQNSSGLNPDFSEQYLVSCDAEDHGCGGGFNSALGYFVDKPDSSGGVGTVVESDYPFTYSNSSCESLNGKTRYTVPTGGSWSYLAGDCIISSVDDTKQAIYTYGPVNAYLYAGTNFEYYTGGIFEDPEINVSPCWTNHVVDLVGWGHDPVKNKDYWVAKNSWGTGWGEDGWFRIYTDQCRIAEGVAYLAAPPSNNQLTIISITPSFGANNGSVSLTNLTGTNFIDGAIVHLTRNGYSNISAAGVSVVSPTKITCTLPLSGATAGLYNVVVRNPDGKEGTLFNGFRVTGLIPETKIGIYNAGNWYIDYNGDGQFIPATGDRYIPYGTSGWTQLIGDWNGDNTSEIGIYKDGLWYIDYGGSGVIDANTRYYSFGGAGWTPLVGDWNADKKDEIGVYQNGNWYLDYDGTGIWGPGDRNYGFGTSGWTPVVGKWTADGISKIGIYHAGNWYIDYNGDGQFIPATGDRYVPYGASDWTQLIGDWNGDNTSEIGIFKDGLWYIDYGGSGVIDANTRYYSFGGAGWTPIVGDWNADKKDEIGVYQNGNWYLDYDGTGIWSAGDRNYSFGTTGWTPVVGKWN